MSNMYGYCRSVSLQTALSGVKIEKDHLMNELCYATYKLLDALKPPFFTRERLFTHLTIHPSIHRGNFSYPLLGNRASQNSVSFVWFLFKKSAATAISCLFIQ